MNITIINYRPNGEDYCMGCRMGSADSEHDIAYFATGKLPLKEVIEGAAQFIANIIFEANEDVNVKDDAYQEDETTILFDGIEASFSSPNVVLENDINMRAEEISHIMITKSKNDAIKAKQRYEELKAIK